jgi:hypothetical protein
MHFLALALHGYDSQAHGSHLSAVLNDCPDVEVKHHTDSRQLDPTSMPINPVMPSS